MAFYQELPNEEIRSQPTQGGKISCPECNSMELIRDYEIAELVCQSCGYVVSTELLDRARLFMDYRVFLALVDYCIIDFNFHSVVF